MKAIDLTHPITAEMPVYPGTEPPTLDTACTIEEMGFLERKITLFSHTGTHVDAPAHLIQGAKTLDQLPLDHFFGKAVCLGFQGVATRTLGLSDLEPHGRAIEEADFVLVRTGWSRHWGSASYFSGYPILSMDAAQWLARQALHGIGFDTISADGPDARDLPVHRVLLGNDLVIIENLTNLDRLPAGMFSFSCLPLRFEAADGSPVRAVAFV